MESAISPYTPEQLANLNHQVDAIYADFMQKVAAGRKLPLGKVQAIAKGRIWSGEDARSRGLVDDLGGFWTAVADAKKLAHIAAGERVSFKIYPKKTSFFAALTSAFNSTAAGVRTLQGLEAIEQVPIARAFLRGIEDAPRGEIEMKATNLPVN
jgi:protease-4